ncbi:unnamed protein product, partial [Amoebophrya sp. A120]|eukprot:GSA120T00021682001.1
MTLAEQIHDSQESSANTIAPHAELPSLKSAHNETNDNKSNDLDFFPCSSTTTTTDEDEAWCQRVEFTLGGVTFFGRFFFFIFSLVYDLFVTIGGTTHMKELTQESETLHEQEQKMRKALEVQSEQIWDPYLENTNLQKRLGYVESRRWRWRKMMEFLPKIPTRDAEAEWEKKLLEMKAHFWARGIQCFLAVMIRMTSILSLIRNCLRIVLAQIEHSLFVFHYHLDANSSCSAFDTARWKVEKLIRASQLRFWRKRGVKRSRIPVRFFALLVAPVLCVVNSSLFQKSATLHCCLLTPLLSAMHYTERIHRYCSGDWAGIRRDDYADWVRVELGKPYETNRQRSSFVIAWSEDPHCSITGLRSSFINSASIARIHKRSGAHAHLLKMIAALAPGGLVYAMLGYATVGADMVDYFFGGHQQRGKSHCQRNAWVWINHWETERRLYWVMRQPLCFRPKYQTRGELLTLFQASGCFYRLVQAGRWSESMERGTANAEREDEEVAVVSSCQAAYSGGNPFKRTSSSSAVKITLKLLFFYSPPGRHHTEGKH